MKTIRNGSADFIVTATLVTLVIGLLLPMAGRDSQEELLVKCRGNLMQIGRAVTLYANDYNMQTPAIGGNFWLEGKDPYTRDKKWILPWKNPWTRPDMPPNHFGCFSALAPSSTQLIVGQPQPWACTEAAPSRAIGLGLLWTGGYLGDKPAETLYCPGSAAGEELVKAGFPRMHQYDNDEPFWTSKGKVVRGDNDKVGNPLTPTGADWYKCTTNGQLSGVLAPGFCAIWSNYSWRIDQQCLKRAPGRMRAFQMAIKLEGTKGIFSDNIDNWIAANGPFTMKQLSGPPQYKFPEAPDSYDMAREKFISNHDAAYNVLFVDGSVKTFKDEAGELYMALLEWRGRASTRPGWAGPHYIPTVKELKTSGMVIWEPFLDKTE